MPFLTLGISHLTAPVAVRERLSFTPEQIPASLRALTTLPGVREAIILSTCNRTELYADLGEGDGEALAEWLSRERSAEDPGVRERFYLHAGDAAVQHLFRVACGLDSQILGEPQILGQIKDAYELARSAEAGGAAGQRLHRLFQFAFAVAKQVRTDTHIGENPVSVAYAAVRLARQVFSRFESLTVLLIGAGETIELAARHLHEQGVRRMVIANRTVSRAHELAAQFNAYAIGLDEIAAHLGEADIVIASTGSPEPILHKRDVEAAFRGRKHRPLLIVDIAVPRDVASDVAGMEDVYLFTIDDLHKVVEENLKSRRVAAQEAELIVQSQVARFNEQLRGLDAVPAIRALREHAADIRDQTLEQARQRLAHGEPPEEVLRFLADTLSNRLMHAPTAQLRQAAHEGREQLIRDIHALFGLDRKDDDA
ncbi:MAG TPA: glutamyl-tRNA reductase [Gammaproteobacteria bacterium]|jgi:glutamyl-tRNA reductase|nr:glutamyl-tRNA reductase [Gammaproteobacteria bacterium]